jgi:hypothetical protein
VLRYFTFKQPPPQSSRIRGALVALSASTRFSYGCLGRTARNNLSHRVVRFQLYLAFCDSKALFIFSLLHEPRYTLNCRLHWTLFADRLRRGDARAVARSSAMNSTTLWLSTVILAIAIVYDQVTQRIPSRLLADQAPKSRFGLVPVKIHDAPVRAGGIE